MLWDRHEIEIRGKLLEILQAYQLRGELFGIPEELREQFIVFTPEALHEMTEEMYFIVKQERLKNDNRGQNPVD